MQKRRSWSVVAALACWLAGCSDAVAQVPCGNDLVSTYHPARCDASGHLIPWNIDANGPFDTTMALQARWWLDAPNLSGWPAYLAGAVLDRQYQPSNGAIPASTSAMAIEAYLKYYAYTGDVAYLNMVKMMGDYVITQGLTPASYAAYPGFPWAVGPGGGAPPDGGGHPNNQAGMVMPDKGAMVGVALLHLYEATGDITYRDVAAHIADVLASRAVAGDATHSPWPFRVWAKNGQMANGPIMGNQVFALRLFDELIRLGITGNGTYQATRNNVWSWLKNVAIADAAGNHWLHFFEDAPGDIENGTQFDALEMARYLIEKNSALDPNWFAMAGSLISLVRQRWTVHSGDYTSIAEQDYDTSPYNSHTARYASILAKYAEAGGPPEYKTEAYSSLAYSTYSVDVDGFTDTYFNRSLAWTSDSFGDWMQHFMDALGAAPEWAPSNTSHLLRSSSVVTTVTYGPSRVWYATFDASGRETLKLGFTPTSVRVDGTPVTSWTWDGLKQVLVITRSAGSTVEISGASAGQDFALSATPGSQTVVQGSSTTYTIDVISLFGFANDVSLSVGNLPAGATANFVPASVTAPGSSTLTLSTTASTPVGTSQLVVTGTSGGASRTATVDVNVTVGGGGSGGTVDFNDAVAVGGFLSGVYPAGLIDWGATGNWTVSEPWGLFTTRSISFSSTGSSASFRFLSSAAGLSGIRAHNGGSTRTTVTISCAGQTTVTTPVPAGQVVTIQTGWTVPCATVTLASTNGWDTNFDDLSYFASAPAPTFTLSVVPASQSVVQGTATSYTVTIAAQNGFAGTVNLSASGLPAGATAIFAPAAIVTSGSATLTVTTAAATPTGTYVLTVTGTSGALAPTGTVTLIVSAPPTFTLSTTPSSRSVVQGSPASYTVTVGAQNGFIGTVDLIVSGLPPGATATFTPASVVSSGASALTVTTTAATPVGTFPLAVSGMSGAFVVTNNITLVVSAPPTFSLSITPSSGSVVQGKATAYTVTVAAQNAFTGVVSLGVSGLPAGAKATFSPASIATSGTSTLTLTTRQTTPVGSYGLTVTATSGNLTAVTPFNLTVTSRR